MRRNKKKVYFETEVFFLIPPNAIIKYALYMHVYTYTYKNKHYRCGQENS